MMPSGIVSYVDTTHRELYPQPQRWFDMVTTTDLLANSMLWVESASQFQRFPDLKTLFRYILVNYLQLYVFKTVSWLVRSFSVLYEAEAVRRDSLSLSQIRPWTSVWETTTSLQCVSLDGIHRNCMDTLLWAMIPPHTLTVQIGQRLRHSLQVLQCSLVCLKQARRYYPHKPSILKIHTTNDILPFR